MNYLPFQRNINASVSLLIIDNADKTKTAYWINRLDNSQQFSFTYEPTEDSRQLCRTINGLFRFESQVQTAFNLLNKPSNIMKDIEDICIEFLRSLHDEIDAYEENNWEQMSALEAWRFYCG